MPAFLFLPLIFGGGGLLGGFALGGGAKAVSDGLKWAVIAGAALYFAKQAKVI